MSPPVKLAPAFDYTYREQLALYKEASAKLATAQEVEVLGKRIRRVDLKSLRDHLAWLEKKVKDEDAGLTGGGPHIYEGRIV